MAALLSNKQRSELLWRSRKWRRNIIDSNGQCVTLKSPYKVYSERELWINFIGAMLTVTAVCLGVVTVLLLILNSGS